MKNKLFNKINCAKLFSLAFALLIPFFHTPITTTAVNAEEQVTVDESVTYEMVGVKGFNKDTVFDLPQSTYNNARWFDPAGYSLIDNQLLKAYDDTKTGMPSNFRANYIDGNEECKFGLQHYQGDDTAQFYIGKDVTLTLDTPWNYKELAFFGASANGVATCRAAIKYVDFDEPEIIKFQSIDWLTPGSFKTTRIGPWLEVDKEISLHAMKITGIDYTKFIESITFSVESADNNENTWVNILAVSAITRHTGTVPHAPKGLYSTFIDSDGFTAHWEAQDDADGYFIDVCTTHFYDKYYPGYANKKVDTNSIRITGLENEYNYWFKVRAYNSHGTSESSISEAITTSPHHHGNSVVKTDKVPPTCEEPGYNEYYGCECGNYFEDEECTILIGNADDLAGWKERTTLGGIAALGHDMAEVSRQEPTCTEPGHEAGYKCARCGHALGCYEIPALGHDFGEPTYSWNRDKTECTATRVCKHDHSHTETETAKAVKNGFTVTVTFTNAVFAMQTTANPTALTLTIVISLLVIVSITGLSIFLIRKQKKKKLIK